MAEERRSVGTSEKKNTLWLEDRKDLVISGVEDVVSLDENGIVLQTVLGLLDVSGRQMKIVSLNREKKEVVITGVISGLLYEEEDGGKRGLFGRILRA